jgi:hypothetical protein
VQYAGQLDLNILILQIYGQAERGLNEGICEPVTDQETSIFNNDHGQDIAIVRNVFKKFKFFKDFIQKRKEKWIIDSGQKRILCEKCNKYLNTKSKKKTYSKTCNKGILRKFIFF